MEETCFHLTPDGFQHLDTSQSCWFTVHAVSINWALDKSHGRSGCAQHHVLYHILFGSLWEHSRSQVISNKFLKRSMSEFVPVTFQKSSSAPWPGSKFCSSSPLLLTCKRLKAFSCSTQIGLDSAHRNFERSGKSLSRNV